MASNWRTLPIYIDRFKRLFGRLTDSWRMIFRNHRRTLHIPTEKNFRKTLDSQFNIPG